jgi:hypothetical protein
VQAPAAAVLGRAGRPQAPQGPARLFFADPVRLSPRQEPAGEDLESAPSGIADGFENRGIIILDVAHAPVDGPDRQLLLCAGFEQVQYLGGG